MQTRERASPSGVTERDLAGEWGVDDFPHGRVWSDARGNDIL